MGSRIEVRSSSTSWLGTERFIGSTHPWPGKSNTNSHVRMYIGPPLPPRPPLRSAVASCKLQLLATHEHHQPTLVGTRTRPTCRKMNGYLVQALVLASILCGVCGFAFTVNEARQRSALDTRHHPIRYHQLTQQTTIGRTWVRRRGLAMSGGDAQPTPSSKRIRFKRWAKRVGRRLLSPFRKGDSKDMSVPAQTGDVAEEDTEEEASLPPTEDALPTNEETIQPVEETVTPTTDGAASNSRQITAANGVDLSGSWRPIATSQFKSEYDAYLQKCGQSFLFRKTVVNGIQLQKETIRQLNGGEYLEIVATNPIGDWNRTLVASSEVKPVCWPITDPDADIVQVESWWEGNGTKHKSVLRDKPNVNGGVFETVRYLEGEDVLVCDSSFLPSPDDAKREYGNVVWRFKRADR